MPVGQEFRYKIFGILKDENVDPMLALMAIALVAEVNWDARPDLDCFLYTFDEETISVLPASVALRLVSVSGERVEKGGMLTRRSEYHEDFASRKIPKAYARRA